MSNENNKGKLKKKIGILKGYESERSKTIIDKDENNQQFYCTNCNNYVQGIKIWYRWTLDKIFICFGGIFLIAGIIMIVIQKKLLCDVPVETEFLIAIGVVAILLGVTFISLLIAAYIYIFKRTKDNIRCSNCNLDLKSDIDYSDKTHQRNLNRKKDEVVVEGYYGISAKAKAIKDIQNPDIKIETILDNKNTSLNRELNDDVKKVVKIDATELKNKEVEISNKNQSKKSLFEKIFTKKDKQ